MKAIVTLFAFNLLTLILLSQNEHIYPVQVNEKFPEITLSTGDGELISIPGKSEKNTLLIFLRGKVTPQVWCPICQYQYLEIMVAEDKEKIREKFNMDIYFVLPYKADSLENWVKAFPKSLQTINGWKNPDNPTENQKLWADYCHEFFPFDFENKLANLELKLPVLFDPEQIVSKGLYLFEEEWGGTKVAQNIPTIFMIDKNGIVRFKYFSQYTNDRPDAKYIIKYLKNML